MPCVSLFLACLIFSVFDPFFMFFDVFLYFFCTFLYFFGFLFCKFSTIICLCLYNFVYTFFVKSLAFYFFLIIIQP